MSWRLGSARFAENSRDLLSGSHAYPLIRVRDAAGKNGVMAPRATSSIDSVRLSDRGFLTISAIFVPSGDIAGLAYGPGSAIPPWSLPVMRSTHESWTLSSAPLERYTSRRLPETVKSAAHRS